MILIYIILEFIYDSQRELYIIHKNFMIIIEFSFDAKYEKVTISIIIIDQVNITLILIKK